MWYLARNDQTDWLNRWFSEAEFLTHKVMIETASMGKYREPLDFLYWTKGLSPLKAAVYWIFCPEWPQIGACKATNAKDWNNFMTLGQKKTGIIYDDIHIYSSMFRSNKPWDTLLGRLTSWTKLSRWGRCEITPRCRACGIKVRAISLAGRWASNRWPSISDTPETVIKRG